MSVINILGVNLKGPNPSKWNSPFLFEITFDCSSQLPDDLEWKAIYVGSTESTSHDQVLSSILVGPVAIGVNKFVLETDAPDHSKIPASEALGITVILLSGFYHEKEFVRIGYYVNNEYEHSFMMPLHEDILSKKIQLDFEKMIRDVDIQSPRVTRFPIDWTGIQPLLANGLLPPSEDITSVEEKIYYDVPPNGNENPSASSTSAPIISTSPFGKKNSTVLTSFDGRDFTKTLDSISWKVFQRINLFDLVYCRRVSKQWKEIIDKSVFFEELDLSDNEWEEFDKPLLDFALKHSAPSLNLLVIPECNHLTDEILTSWLAKCGSTIRVLDVSYCSKLTSKSLDIVTQYCKNLEELNFLSVGSELIFSDQSIQNFCTKFQQTQTLSVLHLNGLTDNSLSIISETLGKSLTYLSLAFNNRITDNAILKLVDKFPKLEILSVELCEFSLETIKELRSKIKSIHSSHTPEDFQVELGEEGEKTTFFNLKLKHRGMDLDHKEYQKILSILPKGCTSVTNETESHYTYDGDIEAAYQAFSKLGFEVLVNDGDEEEIEGDDVTCEICEEGPENEDSEMLCCEECGKYYHPTCLANPVEQKENWVCEDCSVERPTKQSKLK